MGIIQHKNFPINLDIEYDTINNSTQIKELIKFIGESKTILTNSYHAVYLSTIMNKKVIVYKPFSTKFGYMSINHPVYSGNLKKDISQTILNFKYKEETIEANDLFYQKVLKLIQTNS